MSRKSSDHPENPFWASVLSSPSDDLPRLVFARFFPDLDLIGEGGPVPDEVYDSYFPEEKGHDGVQNPQSP